ncbi:RsmB/NOP family class I SAM-dependent RNA methyltransferase [Sphingomonas jatrophae]|uniref:16S rRNA (Cytosine967-C5)-methyltransferase n=1 Tax=Sphingomonas jatrophae TaxID=1166337 RepID=A0A1I6L617_9SPHN|nr:RsmB/NOP family class I SAM-dependent RNA methyltransferase [Sphingomonas jatrophae]SFR98680.1 16S rRNA (cytosine967-C5)-methyltransferase [Sphingomonas jatrophae]
MTPQARVQAAIDILDAVIAAATRGGAAADTLIAGYFKARRYAGSKDRRAVRDLAYRAIRRAGERPVSGRAAMIGLAADDPALAALFDGAPHGPAPIAEGEPVARAGIVPTWIAARLSLPPDELPGLLTRATLDVRLRARDPLERLLAEVPGAEPLPFGLHGARLPADTQVEQLRLWQAGAFEVQDAGSQLVTRACGAAPGMTVVDLCAGAGGKTLALADTMAGEGRLIACDVDRPRLSRLPPRAARAGVEAEIRLLDGNREADALTDLRGAVDLVVIDAPCSGTGTWRRNPEARWRLTPERLARLVETQGRLLDLAAPLVRPGGAIGYIVCSLLDEEGRAQVNAFLARTPGWAAATPPLPAGRAHGAGVRLTPASDGTDGFFVARLKRAC